MVTKSFQNFLAYAKRETRLLLCSIRKTLTRTTDGTACPGKGCHASDREALGTALMPQEASRERNAGLWAEDLAFRRLQQSGLTLLGRNYRCRSGELDLIMRDSEALVFVEVRFRGRGDYGTSAESVDLRKQRRIVLTARHYLQRHPDQNRTSARFDVVLVGGEPARPTVEWIKNAFQA